VHPAGSGPEAKSGDNVTMSYRGTLEDGTEFDAANKFDFEIDEGTVIRGWDQGIKAAVVFTSPVMGACPEHVH
jgi:FKBP-type peptidyl-prolyl cis-trans isomerase